MSLTIDEFKKRFAEEKKSPLARGPSGDSLGDLGDALEKLEGLPEVDGFVFLAGVPRRLGLRKR